METEFDLKFVEDPEFPELPWYGITSFQSLGLTIWFRADDQQRIRQLYWNVNKKNRSVFKKGKEILPTQVKDLEDHKEVKSKIALEDKKYLVTVRIFKKPKASGTKFAQIEIVEE